MRFGFLFFLLAVTIFSKENNSFITEQEYAENLYKNPRGIGCDKCHGKRGEGMIIAQYIDQGKSKSLKTETINSIDFNEFKRVLKKRHGVRQAASSVYRAGIM